MKKILLLLAFTTYFGLNGQVLSFDDHSNLTIGNIGTDLTGVVSGQDGYITYSLASSVASNLDFQIVDKGGIYGNAIQIIGSSNQSGSRVLNKTNLESVWSTRNVGNDIIEVEMDIFTGPASSSRNNIKIFLYSDQNPRQVIAGIGFSKINTFRSGAAPNQIETNYTNQITGYYYANLVNNPGSFRVFFGSGLNSITPQETINDNTWIKIGFSYNKLTGQTRWKGAGINGSTNTNPSIITPNLNPSRLSINVQTGNLSVLTNNGTPPVVIFPAVPNATSATYAFDNIKISATSTDNLLSNDSFNEFNNDFTVFPNPVNSIINISNTENVSIDKISIKDINGRIVKTENFVNISNIELNISDLNTGLYFMNIYSDKGMTTKKIIKN